MGKINIARVLLGGLLAGVVMNIFEFVGAIWLYAAARPRFGPGPKTAAITGFGYCVFGYALPNFGYGAMGLFPTRLLVIGTIVGLVGSVLPYE